MKTFNNILCVIEPNDNSEAALIHAVKIANDHQANITFVSALSKVERWRKLFKSEVKTSNDIENYSTEKMTELKKWLTKYDIVQNEEVRLYNGIGFIETIKDVIKGNYDLVVKCAENVDWLDHLFGSDDMHLLRKCPCPVLMLAPCQNSIFRNIMATVDVNDDHNEEVIDPSHNLNEQRVQETLNKSVLNYATSYSLSDLTQLHICSVWDVFGESHLRHSTFSHASKKEVDAYVEGARLACVDKLNQLVNDSNNALGKDIATYIQPKLHLVKGNPCKEIPLFANSHNIDLIVMGSVARTGIPGFIIGNTAESILGQVKCSVLVVKPDGFISPVIGN